MREHFVGRVSRVDTLRSFHDVHLHSRLTPNETIKITCLRMRMMRSRRCALKSLISSAAKWDDASCMLGNRLFGSIMAGNSDLTVLVRGIAVSIHSTHLRKGQTKIRVHRTSTRITPWPYYTATRILEEVHLPSTARSYLDVSL